MPDHERADEEVFAVDGSLDQNGPGTYKEDVEDAEDLGGMIIPDLVVGSSPVVKGGLAAAAGEDGEVIVVDGEAFESSTGPGCYEEDMAGKLLPWIFCQLRIYSSSSRALTFQGLHRGSRIQGWS